jgi:hypothetical protein
MDFEETEARNDCAGEDKQQFNRLTDLDLVVSTHLQLRGFSRQGTKAEESPLLGNVTEEQLVKIITD